MSKKPPPWESKFKELFKFVLISIIFDYFIDMRFIKAVVMLYIGLMWAILVWLAFLPLLVYKESIQRYNKVLGLNIDDNK